MLGRDVSSMGALEKGPMNLKESRERDSLCNMGLSDFVWDIENETLGALGFTIFKVDRL